MKTRGPIGVALLIGLGVAVAQTTLRNLPGDAERGYLTYVRGNVVSLDGKELRLAPGSQIRGQNNLLLMPAALPPRSLVKYRLDRNGDLVLVWILTPEEAAQPDAPAPRPAPGQSN